jgi:threonine synthase
MEFVQGLQCVFCGRTYPAGDIYTCTRCGISGILDVIFDYPAIARRLSRRTIARRSDIGHWRYKELLPVRSETAFPDLLVGGTPLTEAPPLARHIGICHLLLKDEGRNATGSLKDRASALGVVKARERRKKIIACASTGNAASSCAGMAASMGIRSVIFVPERAPEPKITQLLIFGATVIRVRGSYEQAFQLCQRSYEKWGWYNRNCAINPFLVEGKKTAGLEIAEQLGWAPVDWIAVSVGDGCTVAGVWKAFRELKVLGLIERAPRILGVQAEGAAPVTAAFRSGDPMRPVEARTLADSIAVGVPRNWKKAVDAVRESRGTMLNVTDDEIEDAMRYTGRLAGIFAEPAAATAVAGLRGAAADGVIGRRASAVALITGNGLKDVRSARKIAGAPFEVAPDGNGLEDILCRQKLVPARS